MDYAKLEAAFRRNKRVRGISVPASFDLKVETLLVGHQLMLWDRAAKYVFREIHVTDLFSDFAQRDIQSLCARMYNRYSGLTTLSENLKSTFERGNEEHKKLFLDTMNRAVGTSVNDLLQDPQSAAEVQAGVDRSTKLITTLTQDLSARLAQEIMKGISEGRDDFSLRAYILEEAPKGYPEWRARLIARDQTSKLFSNLSRVRQQDLGITQYRWRTVGDMAVRDTHEALASTLQEWSSPPDVGHPGEDIQCRCVADPVLETARLYAA